MFCELYVEGDAMQPTLDLPTMPSSVEPFIQNLFREAESLRLYDVFTSPHPQNLYYVLDRSGITTIARPTHAFSSQQMERILAYRLANYVIAGQVDPTVAYKHKMMHDPLTHVQPDDIHIIAGSAKTGHILCYIVMKAAVTDIPDLTISSAFRPLLPVEEHFGPHIFREFPELPDIPLKHIREIGPFVKNHQLQGSSHLLARAPLEVMLALLRLLTGPLSDTVRAAVGNVNPHGHVKRILDFFQVPVVCANEMTRTVGSDDYLSLHYQSRDCAPFANKCADIPCARLDLIEYALSLPDKIGMKVLLALKASGIPPRSSFGTPEYQP